MNAAQRRPQPDVDAAARERALDIGRSFLVQAPAGSGKTELLIQRFLALLARVDRPERIVAMTFTKKAAGEMRERIVAALRDADANVEVRSAHARRTRTLAQAALEQDRRQGWQLAAYPARLAVFTIDALATKLARQAPLATGLGAAPGFEENAAPFYARAARAALAAADEDDRAWRSLLLHLDNDANVALSLVADMLAKREQWLSELRAADRDRFRAMLEATLEREIAGEIAIAAELFPNELRSKLVVHQDYASANLALDTETEERARHLAAFASSGGLPPVAIEAQAQWRTLGDWLMVLNKAQFRASVNTKLGFPAVGSGYGAGERRERNAAMSSFLLELGAIPGLADALHVVRSLPAPRYGDDTWAIVEALLEILPRAAAELAVAFREAGKVDFTQATIAALDALGDETEPTDLLLKLDLRLAHLLIDEFQDTSFLQLALVNRLTAGWTPGDGRTLFAVGDPMQSVYRFRGAEVRLFVEAQERGRIGDVAVETVVLRNNFRSQAGLVDWVNRTFPHVLGARSDPWRGTVGFAPGAAVGDTLDGDAVSLDLATDPDTEAQHVVERVRAALREEGTSIAVLVRARPHLAALLPAFRASGIDFAAVELDTLAERQAVRDLVALAHAIAQPADRYAWLSVLRAPWCGLALVDVFAIVERAEAQHGGIVAPVLRSPLEVRGLSDEGGLRLARIAGVLEPVLAARGRSGLAARVRSAWLALGGPATLEERIDLDAAESFFALLEKHERAGDVADWAAFLEALDELHAASDARDATRVQVMTLHHAKGLEFDVVVLPGLARAQTRPDNEILRWRRRPRGLLLAPMKPRGGPDDPVYDYLGLLAAAEEGAELGRLLYVGCTRAKRRLHLSAVLEVTSPSERARTWKPPASGSALAKLWNALDSADAFGTVPSSPTAAPPEARLLRRVPAQWTVSRPPAGLTPAAPAIAVRDAPPFDWVRETARHVGTVAHRVYAQIAREGIAAWSRTRVATLMPRLRAELAREGVDEAELGAAAAAVAAAVNSVLQEPRGRWLFDPAHGESRSEWALAGFDDGAIVRIAIDRTFVVEGVRWIVEFKTGTHEGADVEGFLDHEAQRYRDQLERYARFVRVVDERPIRLGIFHPLLAGWREWGFEG